MTGEVILFALPKREPAWSGPRRCLGCKHMWDAEGDTLPCPTEIECPKCHTHRGVAHTNFSVPEGYVQWNCTCGETLFEVTLSKQDGALSVLCIACGTYGCPSE